MRILVEIKKNTLISMSKFFVCLIVASEKQCSGLGEKKNPKNPKNTINFSAI
jgi:hypothetical protein